MALTTSIAYFITPHGFGHASRAAAVMEAVLKRCPQVRFELFTTCPKIFFDYAVGDNYGYHAIKTDIGMVQISPLEEDLAATCDQLDQLLPYDPQCIRQLTEQLKRLKCCMVICDIAPLGIEIARQTGIASVLIENFTWDWIYLKYADKQHRFRPHILYLSTLYQRVDHHLQTSPLCRRVNQTTYIPPISRKARTSRTQIRRQLEIPDDELMVLVSMGGVPDRFEFLSTLPENLGCRLVIPGSDAVPISHDHVKLLPTHSNFYHPDLMAAADALVGKAGYSTIAEAYQFGIPFGFIGRPHSPESTALETFIKEQMPHVAIPQASYANGEWISFLPRLFNLQRNRQRTENGADTAAEYIANLL
jgi:hypothetical protein